MRTQERFSFFQGVVTNDMNDSSAFNRGRLAYQPADTAASIAAFICGTLIAALKPMK